MDLEAAAAFKAPERVQVSPNTSPPYSWICYLQIEDAEGVIHSGNGFKINFPDINYTVIVTAASNIYLSKEYASRIAISFPGQPTIMAAASDLYVPPDYVDRCHSHDYGFIVLPGSSDEGFGWTTQTEETHLIDRLVTNCGYPNDKTAGSMWITGGEIVSVEGDHITYKCESSAGQAGSPIYTWYHGHWTVIAVQNSGRSPDPSGIRFTIEMISDLVHFKKVNYPTKTLQSMEFSNIFVRCAGSTVTQSLGSGSGVINCQHGASAWEKFYIYPFEMPPSLVTKYTKKVVIESAQWKNVFIRSSQETMKRPNGSGGGIVNCQYGAGPWEVFFLKEEGQPNIYSIVSAQFPHCRIRIDGRPVTRFAGQGGGTVNCQYYSDINGPALGWEKIKIA